MLGLAQTQPLTPASQRRLAPRPASRHSSLATHHCLNQSLAKHNRKPSRLIENNHQRPKSIASFCRVFCNYTCNDAQPKSPCANSKIFVACGFADLVRITDLRQCEASQFAARERNVSSRLSRATPARGTQSRAFSDDATSIVILRPAPLPQAARRISPPQFAGRGTRRGICFPQNSTRRQILIASAPGLETDANE